MRDTYTALYDDAATARAELLEPAILLLIVFEIVMALWYRRARKSAHEDTANTQGRGASGVSAATLCRSWSRRRDNTESAWAQARNVAR